MLFDYSDRMRTGNSILIIRCGLRNYLSMLYNEKDAALTTTYDASDTLTSVIVRELVFPS